MATIITRYEQQVGGIPAEGRRVMPSDNRIMFQITGGSYISGSTVSSYGYKIEVYVNDIYHSPHMLHAGLNEPAIFDLSEIAKASVQRCLLPNFHIDNANNHCTIYIKAIEVVDGEMIDDWTTSPVVDIFKAKLGEYQLYNWSYLDWCHNTFGLGGGSLLTEFPNNFLRPIKKNRDFYSGFLFPIYGDVLEKHRIHYELLDEDFQTIAFMDARADNLYTDKKGQRIKSGSLNLNTKLWVAASKAALYYDDYEFALPAGGGVKIKLTSALAGGGGSFNFHGLEVGDEVFVNQNDGGVTKPNLEGGPFTILEIADNYIIIDLNWNQVNSGPSIGGVAFTTGNTGTNGSYFSEAEVEQAKYLKVQGHFFNNPFNITSPFILGETHLYKFIEDCDKGLPVHWLNAHGSLETWYFDREQTKSANISSIGSTKKSIGFDFKEDGEVDNLKIINDEIKLTTDWLSEQTYNWLSKSLTQSPFVLVEMPSGYKMRAKLGTTSWKEKRNYKDLLLSFECSFKLSETRFSPLI